MARGDQVSRQWKLLQVLASRGGQTVPDLMREMGCSRRTIRRDLEVLQAVGFPLTDVRDGRDSRHGLMEGARSIPTIPFTIPELMSLHMGRHLLVPLRATPFGASVHTALQKIATTLSPEAKAFLDRIENELSAQEIQSKNYKGLQDILKILYEVIQARQTIEVEYHSFGRDTVTQRRLNPLHLWHQQGGIYLAAFCHQRQEIRTFAVERFRRLHVTNATFELPTGFNLDQYLEASFGLSRGRPIRVSLRFSRAVAHCISERRWHSSQSLEPLLTGELDLTLRVPISPELKRWIMSYGKDVTIREPARLREDIRREWLAALRGEGGRAAKPQALRKKSPRSNRMRAATGVPAEELLPTRPR